MSGKIFINYRRSDGTGTNVTLALLVESLADRLAMYFGRDAVYLDTTLRPGDPYPEALRARIADAAVLLVVIHPDWLAEIKAKADRRDWVRDEIAMAIAAGIRLLPVVLDKARLPDEKDLPPSVRALAKAQAITMHFGSLREGLAAITAEIELSVASDVPTRVAPVAPLPDRGGLAVVLVLILASGLLGAFAAVTDALPFPQLRPSVSAAILAGAALFYLVLILLISASMYAIRRPMAWVDERLVRTPHRAHVVFGLGVLAVAVCQLALLAIAGARIGSSAFLLTALLSIGILIAMGLLWLRNQERTPDWPHAPASPTPIWVRKALVDLEYRVDTWPAPLSLRQQREALVALSAVRGALVTMSEPSTQTLLAWWRTRSPWVTFPHATLAGLALTLSTTALALHWSVAGADPVSTLLWLGASLLTVGAYGCSLILEHQRERWQIRAVTETASTQLATLEGRLSELSQPGLIAAHRTEARIP